MWPVVRGTVAVRVIVPLTLIESATVVADRGWGVFWQYGMSLRYAIPVSLIALDLALYAQHVVLHTVPLLWRRHRTHHADPGFDETTGVRFNSFELAFSAVCKVAVVVAVGAPAVVVFEIWLNAGALCSHGNVS